MLVWGILKLFEPSPTVHFESQVNCIVLGSDTMVDHYAYNIPVVTLLGMNTVILVWIMMVSYCLEAM